MRCCKKHLDEAEKNKNENSIKISELNSKIISYERKLKARDSLLTKMDTEMNQVKIKNAAKLSDLNSKISSYELKLKSMDFSSTKMDTEMNQIKMKNAATIIMMKLYKTINESHIVNIKLKEELDAADEAHKQELLRLRKPFERLLKHCQKQRDDYRALYNHTRYTIT